MCVWQREAVLRVTMCSERGIERGREEYVFTLVCSVHEICVV